MEVVHSPFAIQGAFSAFSAEAAHAIPELLGAQCYFPQGTKVLAKQVQFKFWSESFFETRSLTHIVVSFTEKWGQKHLWNIKAIIQWLEERENSAKLHQRYVYWLVEILFWWSHVGLNKKRGEEWELQRHMGACQAQKTCWSQTEDNSRKVGEEFSTTDGRSKVLT